LNEEIGIEVWRGGVNTWECDGMGHLNVRFYVAKAMEGMVGLAAALGLDGAFRPTANSTLMVRDQHVRFLREARPRDALHMTGGVLAMGDDDARLLQLLIHSATGQVAASFQTVVAHVTAGGARAFPWSDETRARAETLRVEVPGGAAPRSLGFEPVGAGEASLANADRMGLMRLAAGAFGPEDCDVFGRMKPEVFIGRVSDGIPGLNGALRDEPADGARPANRGGAALEYRLVYRSWPRAGDRFVMRSGLAAVDARAQRFVHWMLDPASGQAWGAAEAIGVALDLDARKIISISPEEQARLAARVTPNLAL
jgi:acyl-CoA thioester hydrolase